MKIREVKWNRREVRKIRNRGRGEKSASTMGGRHKGRRVFKEEHA